MPLLASLRLPTRGLSPAASLRRWTKSAWQGVVEIGHNSLAVVGLACIGVVLFFSGDSALRHQIERQALEWLNLRHGTLVSGSADVGGVDLLADLNEPEAVARATARPLSALTRQQAQVASWIARRYRVAPEPMARLVHEAWVIGKKANLDPTLILAIMAVESSFNPFAQSPVGAQGLMQVMTSVHDDKYASFGGKLAAFDPVTNLRVGVQVLTECIARAGGSLEAGLKFYVGAANLPDDGGYAERVLTEQSYLRQVADGQNVALTAPLQRSTVSAAPAAVAANSTSPATASGASNTSIAPTHVFGAAAAAVSKVVPFVGNGNTVMAPALGTSVVVNLSGGSGNSSLTTPVPSAMTGPVADKAAAAPTHTSSVPANAVPAVAPTPTPAATTAPAPIAPAAPAAVTGTSAAMGVVSAKPVVQAPAGSAPAETRPKTETAATPAPAADARVALAPPAPR